MEQTSYVVDDFVREWKKVWEAVACLPNFESDLKGRLLVDLANEPDSQWQVRGGGHRAGQRRATPRHAFPVAGLIQAQHSGGSC